MSKLSSENGHLEVASPEEMVYYESIDPLLAETLQCRLIRAGALFQILRPLFEALRRRYFIPKPLVDLRLGFLHEVEEFVHLLHYLKCPSEFIWGDVINNSHLRQWNSLQLVGEFLGQRAEILFEIVV